jgi:hypothetical protein
MDDSGDIDYPGPFLAGLQVSLESAMSPSKFRMKVIYKSSVEHDHWTRIDLQPPPPLSMEEIG